MLKTRAAKGKWTSLPLVIRTLVSETNFQVIYETRATTNAPATRFAVTHDGTNASRYELDGATVANADTKVPFAGSDFWLADLGLEFLHWPAQKLTKHEIRRAQMCAVLESANPGTNGCSRIVSWIDDDTGGILHADAYDARGAKLKEFEPKEFKKVNGQWQLQEMEIRNVQTESKTRMDFDLNPK